MFFIELTVEIVQRLKNEERGEEQHYTYDSNQIGFFHNFSGFNVVTNVRKYFTKFYSKNMGS